MLTKGSKNKKVYAVIERQKSEYRNIGTSRANDKVLFGKAEKRIRGRKERVRSFPNKQNLKDGITKNFNVPEHSFLFKEISVKEDK